MNWYFVETGTNWKDTFGETAYVELENPDRDSILGDVQEEHPDMHRGEYVESFTKMDWDLAPSSSFDTKEAFMQALGEVVDTATASNACYTQKFGHVSINEARSMAR